MAVIDFLYIKEIVLEVIHFIQIPSIKGLPEPGAPFGKDVRKCLDYALNFCSKMGMQTKVIEDRVGYAEYGSGPKEIAVLVHLDVVPVDEEQWHYGPFQGVMEDNKIYGRGALDDKGPAVSAIFAVKRLIDDVKKWTKRVRIIFCTDEESGWADLPSYLASEKQPDFAFTPDAAFPLVFAEKGILHVECDVALPANSWLKDFSGGLRPNIVPELCQIKVDPRIEHKLEKVKHQDFKITFEGKAAHASLPENGKNAVVKALSFLSDIEEELEEEGFFDNLHKIFKDFHGKGLEIDLEDKKSGKLTMNVGKVSQKGQILTFTLDIRIPVTAQKETVMERIREKIPSSREIHFGKPIDKSSDSPEIKMLLSAYKEVCPKEEAKPIAIGGGTLARGFDNAVAFGPLFPEEEETAHMSNEYITVETLLKSHEIYYRALKKLLESDEW